jgi:2-C-methyl-D-erythritol 4-phosphate cytidylyltransferase
VIAAALIPAAGRGRRMGQEIEKQFMRLAGKPLLAHTLARIEATSGIDQIVVIVPPGREAFCMQAIVEAEGLRKVTHIVAGAETRQGSVIAGFRCVREDIDVVVIHDGARPFVSPALIQMSIEQAYRRGSAVVAVPVSDTLKRVSPEGDILETVDRQHLWRAQTPQAFRRSILQRALVHAEAHQIEGTDEASLVESMSQAVHILPGSIWNVKVTTPDDLTFAESMLAQDMYACQSALGFRPGEPR